MSQFCCEFMYIERDCRPIDVKKKLRSDWAKDDEWSLISIFDGVLAKVGSELFGYLPDVMKQCLLDPLKNSRCQLTFRPLCEEGSDREGVYIDCNETNDENKFPISESSPPEQRTVPEQKAVSENARSTLVLDTGLEDGGVVAALADTPVFDAATQSESESPMFEQVISLIADGCPVVDTAAELVCEKGPVVQCVDRSVSVPDGVQPVSVPDSDGDQSAVIQQTSEALSLELECDPADEQAVEDLSNLVPDELGLKIARNRYLTPGDTLKLESNIELRSVSSDQEEQTRLGILEMDLKAGGTDRIRFQQPQPPGRPTSVRRSRTMEEYQIRQQMELIQHSNRLLGCGGFGQVYRARNSFTGYFMALKTTKADESGKDEIEIMEKLDHRSIVKMYWSWQQDNHVDILLEWMAGGSVEDVLNDFGPFHENVIWNYSKQIFDGLAYLHQLGILHCDVKGGNVLVDNSGLTVKLCDFGLAKWAASSRLTKPKGTLAFMARELFDGECNSTYSDIWSAGCTVFQMATAEQPWPEFKQEEGALIWKICTQKLAIPSFLSEPLKKLISDCLELSILSRPSASDLQKRCKAEVRSRSEEVS